MLMIHSIHIDEEAYPLWLKEIYDAPERIYVQGNIQLLKKSGIAIVGMRRCSKLGENLAFEWARDLSRQGHPIVSGLAFGIDAAAHKGALCGNGATIAVIPACLPEIIPASHRSLADEILQKGGLLLSEWSEAKLIQKSDYLVRNRIISGLSRGVVVIEAAERSGALNTVAHALEQNRDVMVVPGRINDPHSQGCLTQLQKVGFLVRSPKQVIECMGLKWKAEASLNISEELKSLYEVLKECPKNAAQLSQKELIQVAQLELEGLVRRDSLGRYMSI